MQVKKKLSRVIRFDDKEISARRENKLLVTDGKKWVERLRLIYNTSKPIKYWNKILAVCHASRSYAWNMQVYKGKLLGQKSGLTYIVHHVTTALQGHTITSNYFFTPYALCTELLQRKLTMVGTVCRNKPELPNVDRRHLVGLWHCFTTRCTFSVLWKKIEWRATKRIGTNLPLVN